MANINIKSYNEILGNMIRKIIADTPVNDINKGSVLLTLLEAAAGNDFDNNAAILNVLELLNIDALKDADLDAHGSNLGLIRKTANKASGFIIVSDSTIVKRSTSLYPIKPAPITGTSVIHVNNASAWNQSGNLYLGSGTSNFEGPLAYTSIINNGTFFTINLASALVNDHLLSESIIDGQGTADRKLSAGTTIKIPSNNINPEIKYSILRDSVIPAGEDTSSQIPVVAIKAGSLSNAGINSIVLFDSIPFIGATVTNTNSFTNGTNTESDTSFRDRIKAYSSTLARGTKRSILSAIDGLSDETDGKQVASAVVTEPATIGSSSIVYIDDGQGFEPSFSGQSVDLLISEASGNEEFLQLANYPLPRPQALNTASAPYLLTNGVGLKVLIDGIEESVIFSTSDFKSISSATISELVVAINNKATTFRCRLSNNSTRLLLYPLNEKVETIQVVSDGNPLDANLVLKFPTNEFSYIALYKNSVRMREIEKSASLISTPFSTWGITNIGNLILSIDGTPDQDRSFSTSDFNGINFNALVLSNWVAAFNNKYAGITATQTTTGRLVLTSNKAGLTSTLSIVGGSYISQIFGGQPVDSIGQNSDFSLNRQNGNLQIKNKIVVGDNISAGSSNTKGSVISTGASGGTFNVSTDANNRPAEVIMVTDANRVLPRALGLVVGTTISLTNQGSSLMRIMSSVASGLKNVQPGDYIYISSRGHIAGTGNEAWIDIASTGLFKVEAKGEHLTDGIDTYVEVKNVNMVVGGPYLIADGLDIQVFSSDKYPQLWRGINATNPAAASINDIVSSINSTIKGVIASVYRTNFIKLTSSTEESGSIAVPISIGNATQLFSSGGIQQVGTQSHVANIVSNKDIFTTFESTTSTNTNVWLNRYTHTDIKSSITTDIEPSKDGTGTYSEILTDTNINLQTNVNYDDSIHITSGQNKKQIRDIRTIIDANNVGTRHDSPRSMMDYTIGDEYQVVKNLEFSNEDNLVAIIDNDAIAKTIDISFSRTGQVNSGSQSALFSPTNLAFSSNDADNEVGIDFGTLDVWGTLASQSNTNFNDYAVWFKARNWYNANGAALIIRAKEFGPIGDKIKFTLEYPTIPNTTGNISHTNNPDKTLVTYTYGSGLESNTGVVAGDQFTITDLGAYSFRITFPATATTSTMSIGDIISIGATSGFTTSNTGSYRINAKNDINKTIDIYNENGIATVVGNSAIHSVDLTGAVAATLDGSYFILPAPNGDTVKFWYDTDGSGTIEPNIGIATRSWKITPATGDSDIITATLTAAAILNDPAFGTATNGGGTLSIITVTNTNKGPSLQGTDGIVTTSFTFALITTGILDTFESLNISSELKSYPITDNDTTIINNKINASNLLEAVIHTSGTFIKATREESGVAINEVSFSHDPNPLNGNNSQISLFDSRSWVLSFQNLNPNFQLKSSLVLNGVSPIYSMDTTSNPNGSTGELFKLVPTTLKNTNHHMLHKALSQLNIVSSVLTSSNNKKIQIKSDLLGSSGAVEIVGGRANSANFKIIGDSQINTSNNVDYLQLQIPASPNTLSPGQHITLSNQSGVERLNRQISTDTMDVVKINDTTYEYRYNNKLTNLNQYVKFTIVDANSIDAVMYPTPGLVWRWTHNDAGSTLSFSDKVNGSIINAPVLQDAGGIIGNEIGSFINIIDSGSISSALTFKVDISDQPTQADYITFENSAGTSYAVWFDIDANGTTPTGATYTSATNKIKISILSTNTPNQISSNMLSQLLTFGIAVDFNISLSAGASFATVKAGDMINAFGILTGWDNTNKSFESGDNKVAGYAIVNVDSVNSFIDVVNPDGKAMTTKFIGAGSSILITSTPIIKWRLNHSAKIDVSSVGIISNTATATTVGPHRLNIGDTFTSFDFISTITPDTNIVLSIVGENQFTYASTNLDTTVTPAGAILKLGKTRTRYKIEDLGYNSLFRLSNTTGDSPLFASLGVAVDDLIVISGKTFKTINNGSFIVQSVDDTSIIYKNINGQEELDTKVPFNNFNLPTTWAANSNQIVGLAGTFANLNIGDWVKKNTDDDTFYVQVSGFNTGLASTATIVTLANNYIGVGSITVGISLDQNTNINTGVYLQNIDDIKILEGDSVIVGDSIFITENTNPNWFDITNSGTFVINALGTNSTDGKVFLRINNAAGTIQSNVSQGIANTKYVITESNDNKFSVIKKIHHIAIDEFNQDRRIVYLTPGNRSYKWNQTNVTSIEALGKIGYSSNITAGVDGYSYYIGLLRKVQRVIDGFEPDSINFPGRKAIGSLIEVLPPLPRRVTIAINVTTQNGINLSEISDEITSVIINYVSDLGVGQDVVLSDIIVRVKSIDGIAAVTFITPIPSQERIAIANDEKSFIQSNDISIA